jgi:hypothetical protein
MSRRKELNKDNYGTAVDIPEGDEQHHVWQAAYGGVFAAYAGEWQPDDYKPVQLHNLACHIADVAYQTYKESIGVHKRTQKSNGKSKNKTEASFSMGKHLVMGESSMAIKITTPEEWIEEFEGKEEAWIPKSQIHADSQIDSDGEEGELLVTAWWAKKRGILGEATETTEDRVPF